MADGANRDSPPVCSQNEKELGAKPSRVSEGIADLQSSAYKVIGKDMLVVVSKGNFGILG